MSQVKVLFSRERDGSSAAMILEVFAAEKSINTVFENQIWHSSPMLEDLRLLLLRIIKRDAYALHAATRVLQGYLKYDGGPEWQSIVTVGGAILDEK